MEWTDDMTVRLAAEGPWSVWCRICVPQSKIGPLGVKSSPS